MGAWGWKIKRWFRQLLPIALAGAVVWGGYNMFFTRGGLRGPRIAITRALRHIPFFGSRFRSHSSYRYGRSQRSYRKYYGHRRGKYHARSKRRRGRRR